MSLEQRFHTEFSLPVDPRAQWKPSNVEPLNQVLPEGSPLRLGVPMLDRVMFACSNTEFKPAILVYGLNSSASHVLDVVRRINPLLGDAWYKRSLRVNVARTVRTAMVPTDFAHEPVPLHFATTPRGELVARDSAAFLLKKAVDLGIPLGPVFQEKDKDAGENPTRTYITRIALLMALKEGASTQVKLVKQIGGSLSSEGVVASNLRELSKKGLISYESAEPEVKGQHVYERVDLTAMPPKAWVLARNVFKYFEHNEVGNNYAIAKALGREHTHDIGRALRQLARAGVIKPAKWSWSERQSDAKITDLGKRVIDEVVIPLLSAYSGDSRAVQILTEARDELTRNPQIAAEALDQYKRQAIRTPELETQQRILAIIQEQGPQRRRQILAQLGKRAHPQLIELVTTGRLKTVRDGNASFYLLPDSEDQPKRAEEIVIFEFNPPPDIFAKQEFRKRDEYRQELDTVEFWQRLQTELKRIPANQYTARRFLLQYDPQHKDWPQRWYSGIFSGHVRALWSLGIEHPDDFIRNYKPEEAPPELQEIMKSTQELMNIVLPVEYSPRLGYREFDRQVDRINTAEFWQELATDALNAPRNTKIESFLWRFDPKMPDNMGRNWHHGKYYNFRKIFDDNTIDGAIVLLTSYRAPEGAPVEVQLAIREAQAALRKNLRVDDVPPDDFSDIEELKKKHQLELQQKQEQENRLQALRAFYERFGQFDEAETNRLKATTAQRVHALRVNIKGADTDETSFAAIGLDIRKYERSELVGDPFPVEVRAAYLVLAFEQSRNGREIPHIPTYQYEWAFRNGEVRVALTTLERYLAHYENQAKKKDSKALLPISVLVEQLKKYIGVRDSSTSQ